MSKGVGSAGGCVGTRRQLRRVTDMSYRSKVNTSLLDDRRYSIRDVVSYADVPFGTLWSWTHGKRPVIETPRGNRQWSFTNIVEARVLRALRVNERIDLDKVRSAVTYLRKQWKVEHPLAHQKFLTDGVNLIFEGDGQMIDASDGGQILFRDVVAHNLRDVIYEKHVAMRLSLDGDRKLVLIDPRVRFGQPFLANSSVPIEVLARRRRLGETVKSIAWDYELKPKDVSHAIEVHEQLRRHAA